MHRNRYTPQELSQLLFEVNSDAPLEKIAAKLNRSELGIPRKLQQLSESYPDTWDPEKVHRYIAKLNSKKWRSPKKNPEKVERSKQKILNYLREHPDDTTVNIERAGLDFDLFIGYNNRLNVARRELGLKERPKRISESQRRRRLLAYMKKHPNATRDDIYNAGYSQDINILHRSIYALRRDAGLVNDEYVSTEEAARALGIERKAVLYLFWKDRLDGIRLGRNIYIRLYNAENRKQIQSK